jgi:hypothetical protein
MPLLKISHIFAAISLFTSAPFANVFDEIAYQSAIQKGSLFALDLSPPAALLDHSSLSGDGVCGGGGREGHELLVVYHLVLLECTHLVEYI